MKKTSRNLDIFKAGSDVLVEVDGRNLGTKLTNAVLFFHVVTTKLVGIYLVPFILPRERLSNKAVTNNSLYIHSFIYY